MKDDEDGEGRKGEGRREVEERIKRMWKKMNQKKAGSVRKERKTKICKENNDVKGEMDRTEKKEADKNYRKNIRFLDLEGAPALRIRV